VIILAQHQVFGLLFVLAVTCRDTVASIAAYMSPARTMSRRHNIAGAMRAAQVVRRKIDESTPDQLALDLQQIVDHRLVGVLVHERRDGVQRPIDDQQRGPIRGLDLPVRQRRDELVETSLITVITDRLVTAYSVVADVLNTPPL